MSSSAYLPRLKEGIARLQQESTESGNNKKWELAGEEEGVKIYFHGTKPADRFMAVTEIDASLEDVLNACYLFDERVKWDDNFSKACKVLETLSDDVSITYQLVEGRMGSSAREMINGRLKVNTANDGVVVVQNNVDYEDKKPITKDIVRAKNYDVGYVLEKTDGGKKTKVTWFVQTELNGWIGMLNIKKITIQNLIALLKKLKGFFKK